MAEINVNAKAYCKLLLHVAKYPHTAVNGVLVAPRQREGDPKTINIVDCFPFFHTPLSLAPMLEVALSQVDAYCKEQGLAMCGYYQANEHEDDNVPNEVAKKIAEKIVDSYPGGCLLMVNNKRISSEQRDIYTVYQKKDTNWKQQDINRCNIDEAGLEAARALLEQRSYRQLMDWDNHLDDIINDWKNPIINEQISAM
ncbi:unnamed protein product [Owenia fusiformis]|uniref:Uncharacterized protein n=1 Tax=Owenia fusiformis TaxID=6347 RepID=A0A8J1UPC6_OWEFU|nr:unnamed protein product [Owenia fusiformis]